MYLPIIPPRFSIRFAFRMCEWCRAVMYYAQCHYTCPTTTMYRVYRILYIERVYLHNFLYARRRRRSMYMTVIQPPPRPRSPIHSIHSSYYEFVPILIVVRFQHSIRVYTYLNFMF